MKHPILSQITALLVAGTLLISCQSSTSKLESAKENMNAATQKVVDANEAFNEALQDSIQEFRDASVKQIKHNEMKIKEFKSKIAKEKKEVRIENEKKLAELEQKNNELLSRMDNYKDDRQAKWDIFKAEFNHDMNELGEAFQGLTIKNVN